ncbi:MAG: 30S ribosomal protein S17 [Alphaproteobacteria bacterium]|jgi:small subunit ribosomal protein S17|nr:30S ribosomal protein S17 [Alphaproteobacteria bacterium]
MPKRVLQGTVVSTKMDKTIVVDVERKFKHPLYKKFIKSNKKFHAHDEKNVAKVGEIVKIIETKPFSKTKTWELLVEDKK